MKIRYLIIIFLAICSCKSPAELLEKGDFDMAFTKAVKQVKKKNNVDQNIEVIKKAARLKVDEAILYSAIYTESDKVSDWVKAQKNIYKLITELGKANIAIDGLIYESYDELCDTKKDIDFQIVDYYYEEGQDHLDLYYSMGSKAESRLAYKSFKNFEKYEGQKFFLDLADNIEDAYQNGIVYYVTNYPSIGSSLFFKPLPSDANFKPDCDITVNHGVVTYSNLESSNVDVQSKEIQTGTKTEIDTSGVATLVPIYETISTTVTTKTITVTASVFTQIFSKDITGQCSVNGNSYHTTETDKYEEVNIIGDTRALDHIITPKFGEPPLFKQNLKSKILSAADKKIGI